MSNTHLQKQQRFMALYEPVHARLARYIRSMVWNEHQAKDLMSETVLIAYEKLDEVRNMDAFVYFLFGIASRLIHNNRRKYSKQASLEQVPEPVSMASGPEARLHVADLYYALGLLPSEQREAVTLFEISGFSLAEIQQMQGASLSAVKSRLSRGRQRLAEIMQADEKRISNQPIV